MTRFTKLKGWAVKSVLAAVGLLFASPILVTLFRSFSFNERVPTLEQYGELLTANSAFLPHFWNSAGYSLAITVLCLIITFPLGFIFAKVRFPGHNAVFFIFVIAMLLPFQTTMMPNFITLRDIGLLNTPWALILPPVFAPFAVFLFRQFIKGIPSELLDSTILETSSVFRILLHAVIPQVRYAGGALAVMIFCESWNMAEPALIFVNRNSAFTPLSVVLGSLPGPVLFSAAAVYMVPIILLYLLFKDTLAASMAKFRWDG
ncbi:MAG: carbohydrate ABC transporter permease [Oscillospiraceae bacterium]|jgi:multiple sugar transport system permease protein|nr:carbohydrate ABC transporter permease [Oscillospiraceae bacterium]